MQVIIVSPSLNSTKNVSGVSSVTKFIIDNNLSHDYVHFELGRKDDERGGIFRIGSLIQSFQDWENLLKKFPDAVIHYNFPMDKPGILRDTPFMSAALKNGNRMVVHIHGGVFMSADNIPWPFRRILKHVFSWQVPFIVLSENEADSLRKRFHARQVVSLPNCIELRAAKAFERKYKDDSSPLTLGYLGRIAQTKGMDFLLQACRLLKERNIPFRLQIAGSEEVEGQYLPQFKQILGSQFEYCGIVSGETKDFFLRNLDVLVMPTFFEGLPMSLLECMSYGVVPVITPVGSVPTVVTDHQNGLFIKVKDAESIFDAITYLHSHRDELRQMSMSARTCIFENFNPEAYINKLNSLYDSLA